MQTSWLPLPSSRDSSRHCQLGPRNSSHSEVTAQLGRQTPLLREMQAKPVGQSALPSQARVQAPAGKLPPERQNSDSQSAPSVHESPGAPLSEEQAAARIPREKTSAERTGIRIG